MADNDHRASKHTGTYELLPVETYEGEHQRPSQEIEYAQNLSSATPTEWISRWLQLPGVLSTGFSTIVLIVVIITLAVISHNNDGLGSVDIHLETPLLHVGDLDLNISLLWTTLPVLIFSIYGMVISAIVTQAATRQPYIELYGYSDDNWGATAEKSIFLDYASYWSVVAPWKAFRNRHWLLVYSLSLMGIVNILLSALSAHIFNATTISIARPIDIERTHEIDDTGLAGNKGLTSLIPTLDIVASTSIYGGQNIPWTTANASVLPFDIPHSLQSKSKWNLRTIATALEAHVSCKALGESEFELLEGDGGLYYFSFSDRGCSIKPYLFVTNVNEYLDDLIQTYWFTCDLEAYYGRIIVVAAQQSDSSSGNFTLKNKIGVSCIPSYYTVTGTLNITGDSSTAGFTIGSFLPTKSSRIDPYPGYGNEFPSRLSSSTLTDNTARIYANSFGALIYFAAKERPPSEAFSGETFANITSALYKSAFAVMVQRFLVRKSSSSSLTTATAFTEEYRVVVVPVIAYIVVGILVALLGMLGWIYWYTKNHHSILYEEPVALASAAANLRRSELMREIESINADNWDGKVKSGLEYKLRNLDPRRGWRVDRWDEPSSMRIISTNRARP